MQTKSTPVPNAVFDEHLKELKAAELKVLLIIIRQTLGWEDKSSRSQRKECDWIDPVGRVKVPLKPGKEVTNPLNRIGTHGEILRQNHREKEQ